MPKQPNITIVYSWIRGNQFPLIFKKYLEFILKSLSTLIEESEDKPINIEERISGDGKQVELGQGQVGHLKDISMK